MKNIMVMVTKTPSQTYKQTTCHATAPLVLDLMTEMLNDTTVMLHYADDGDGDVL